jgi:hypothetical protein
MSILSSGIHTLKDIRWMVRRRMVALRYGLEALERAPKVFGNAMPKSGSHLLTQILGGLTCLGPFVDPGLPPVNRSETNQPLPSQAVIKNIQAMRPGDIRYGYIHAEEPYLSLLTQSDWATIFIYRDPRDMLVSHIFYATEMNRQHGMHAYYTENLATMEERINAAIAGVTEPGYELASVRQRYDSYWGWFEQPAVLRLKYEDLILERQVTLGLLLDHLESHGFPTKLSRREALATLERAITPEKSGTFRKGQPGNWRVYFTESNKVAFHQVAGDLLVKLGYETGQNW